MKSIIKFIGLGLLALSFTMVQSCKDSEEKTSDNETNASEPALIKANTVTPTDTNNNGDVALNPAHGQPGHRCDIPVGAPLDGSSATNNTQSSPVLNSGGVTPSGNLTVNPAHGQPGHRCDIKVGDPLPDA